MKAQAKSFVLHVLVGHVAFAQLYREAVIVSKNLTVSLTAVTLGLL